MEWARGGTLRDVLRLAAGLFLGVALIAGYQVISTAGSSDGPPASALAVATLAPAITTAILTFSILTMEEAKSRADFHLLDVRITTTGSDGIVIFHGDLVNASLQKSAIWEAAVMVRPAWWRPWTLLQDVALAQVVDYPAQLQTFIVEPGGRVTFRGALTMTREDYGLPLLLRVRPVLGGYVFKRIQYGDAVLPPDPQANAPPERVEAVSVSEPSP